MLCLRYTFQQHRKHSSHRGPIECVGRSARGCRAGATANISTVAGTALVVWGGLRC